MSHGTKQQMGAVFLALTVRQSKSGAVHDPLTYNRVRYSASSLVAIVDSDPTRLSHSSLLSITYPAIPPLRPHALLRLCFLTTPLSYDKYSKF
ncbi:hypothetical protein L6164_008110 [Bauhinia variegata]|uniref:Uncharacterized protein n=1 Tax=Bauhinia variegata TaxID=167791 RepID=A0ACB9PG05_BAUVA|nr:hypothetical protein L6164_008110 [Bauhinia variegata]